jgi:aspartyl-tRNA(Asn)/glutamyl-tRNA(Gln) amidotransferase subunit C
MTSRISLDEVKKVAALARLALDDGELAAMQAQLDRILDYMKELDAVDVTGVPPTYHAPALAAALRADVPVPSLHRDEVLAAAPRHDAGAFAAPKVLEGS